MMLLQDTKTAVYCRLSREDGNEESQSIQSQKEILVNYVHTQGWQLYDIYIDDGYSGTNFDRPDFQRLLKDVEQGKINIVLTKDLSRLGRNYIQTGYYTEEYFPDRGVRYIALNDNYDTQDEDSNDFAPFKNIINEWYAKDISKKIRFTLDNQAKNGEARRTVFPLFGYAWNERNERIPDPETAPIVKLIFEKFLETTSASKVARFLRENKIKRPCYYNAIKYGYNKAKVLAHDEEYFYKWTHDVVHDILINYEYTGAYITAKSKSISFKSKKRDKDNKNKFIFEGRYEALVDKETFNKVQNMVSSAGSGTIPVEKNVFKGVVRCAECGEVLRFERRSPNKKNKTEVLRYYCNNKNCNCSNTIKLDRLASVVIKELMTLKRIILNHEVDFLKKALEYDSSGKYIRVDHSKEIEKYTKRNDEIDKYIQILFEQNVKGKIPEATYDKMMEKYLKEKNLLKEQIRSLTIQEQNEINTQSSYYNEAQLLVEQLKLINEKNALDTDTLRTFVKWVAVKTTKKEYQYNKCNYAFTFRYLRLDELIKEFLQNEE